MLTDQLGVENFEDHLNEDESTHILMDRGNATESR